jgi:hypothetical protein
MYPTIYRESLHRPLSRRKARAWQSSLAGEIRSWKRYTFQINNLSYPGMKLPTTLGMKLPTYIPRCKTTHWRKRLCTYAGVKLHTHVPIRLHAYPGLKPNTQVWKFLLRCETSYSGMKLPTKVWNFLLRYETSYSGMKLPTQVWNFLLRYETSYSGMKLYIPRNETIYPGKKYVPWYETSDPGM